MIEECEFSIIVTATVPVQDDALLNAADALGRVGVEPFITGHAEGMRLLFRERADSLRAAIAAAIASVEQAGLPVRRIELERDAFVPA